MYTFWRAQLALKALEAEDRVLEAATGWDWAGSRSTPEPTLTYFGQWAFSRIIRPSTVHGPSGRRYCRCFVVVITWAAAGVEREGGLLLSRGDQLILGGRVVCRGVCRGAGGSRSLCQGKGRLPVQLSHPPVGHLATMLLPVRGHFFFARIKVDDKIQPDNSFWYRKGQSKPAMTTGSLVKYGTLGKLIIQIGYHGSSSAGWNSRKGGRGCNDGNSSPQKIRFLFESL